MIVLLQWCNAFYAASLNRLYVHYNVFIKCGDRGRGMNDNELNQLSKTELIRLVTQLKKHQKYGLFWEEKPENVVIQCQTALPVLEETVDKSLDLDQNQPTNILIEGDNYHALSVLNYTHAGKIDVIYIDPPYNRGNKDFKYNDNYVDKEDSYRHSKWLSFMESRLKLAKNLLVRDGVLFISIDDIEYANLKFLCDKLFTVNKVETYIWCLQDKTEGSFVKTSKTTVRKEHEYLIACFNGRKKFYKYRENRQFSEGSFTNPDNDSRGPWFSGNISRTGIKTTTGSKYFTITTPKGKQYSRNWTIDEDEFKELDKSGDIYYPRNGYGVPRQKIFEESDKYSIQSSLFTDVHTSITGKNELKDFFMGNIPFDYPKPTTLIDRLIAISSDKKDIKILDFFAGTGTTGHAVLNLNKRDNGKRTFILCTNDEGGICTEICYPRLHKLINGYSNNKGEYKAGITSNLKYYRTSFVSKSIVSDDTKNELVRRSTEMICLREGTFICKVDNPKFKIFSNNREQTGILFDLDAIDDFKIRLEENNCKTNIYVFSLTNDTFVEDFEDLSLEHEICPIPESILEVYKRLFSEGK